MSMKKLLGMMGLAYLLGVTTPLLVLFGAGWLGSEAPSFVVELATVVALVLIAAGLIWLLTRSPKPEETQGASSRAASPPVWTAPTGLRDGELPTITDYYYNTPDGYLGRKLGTFRDFDPASEPAFAVDGEGKPEASR